MVRATLAGRHAIKRALGAAGAGVVAFAITMMFAPWQAAFLLGWVAMAGSFVGSVLVELWDHGAEETAAVATREDDSRAVADLFLVSAAGVSLAAVAFGLLKAGEEHGAARVLFIAATVVSVFLSWGVVQTVFTLRYARLYYREPEGGVEFNQDDDPDFLDFVYLALTVGMTYQVSDTNISGRAIRRTISRHALLSFLFATVVVAVMINAVASLLS